MKQPGRLVLLLLPVLALVLADDTATSSVVKARVESCGGWRLNRLPQIKKFIYEDIPLFHNVEFKSKPGANPDLLLLNSNDEIIERIDLSKFDREGCNQMLMAKGFYKKATVEEEVPEQYLQGPYIPKQEL